jgi:FAD-dependent oxidoreductase domain-containing protein 1
LSETKYDVLVVGAGILGISSAYYIKKNNPQKKVLVIERFSSVGQGNTGRSNAMFRNTFSSEDNQLLSDSTISYYLHVQEETGVDLGVELLGYLWLMSSPQLSKSQKFVERMRTNRIETKQYSRDELRSLIPGLDPRHERSDEES